MTTDVVVRQNTLPFGTKGAAANPERPTSPPQLIPHPRAGAGSSSDSLCLSPNSVDTSVSPVCRPSISPLTSCISELPYFDATSEAGRSVSSSLDDVSSVLEDARLTRSKPSSSGLSPSASFHDAPSALIRGTGSNMSGGATDGSSSGCAVSWHAQYWTEVQRRAAAESALKDLQLQLDDLWVVLQAHYHCPSLPSSAGAPAAAKPAAMVAAALAEHRRASEHAAAEAADGVVVARMVAGAFGRAAAAADLQQSWAEEQHLLQRRLDQASHVVDALLRRQQRQQDVEPWRQQLLNGLLSAGCLALGAAVAAVIVSKSQAANL